MTDRERLINVLNEAFIKSDDNFGIPNIEQVADYLIANGVIPLPCKVGDTVYHFAEVFGTIFPYFVEDIHISYWGDNGQNALYTFEANYHYEDVLIDCVDFELDDIGKTVFLTREEAEKALKERPEK